MLWIGLLLVLSLDAALGVVVVASALSVALDALFGTTCIFAPFGGREVDHEAG